MFDYAAHIRPGPNAGPGKPLVELSAGEALSELYAALDGWLCDAVTARSGYLFDPDREHAGQIMLSLYRGAGLLRDNAHKHDEAGQARDLHAANLLQLAAGAAEHGAKTAQRAAGTESPDSPAEAAAYIRAWYHAAVAGVRQVRTVLVGPASTVSAVATTTRCAGGSPLARCSHGRSEDHHLADEAGPCEAAVELRETTPCNGTPPDSVLVRDRILGPLGDDRADDRGVRGCVAHGARLLAYTARATVHPGPGAWASGSLYVLEATEQAGQVPPGGRVLADRFRTSPAAVAAEAGR